MPALSSAARPRRSALYMPAANPRALVKARTLDCDVVILDLEDAVAPEMKPDARAAAVAAARDGFGGRELVVRANALDTEWGRDDLVALAGAPVNAVLVPKISRPSDFAAIRAVLGEVPLWAMVETAAAMLDLAAIAAAAAETGVTCLVAGTNDLAQEMRCTPGVDRAPLLAHLTAIVTAARAYGLVALDGVCNAIDDPARLAAECAQGAAFGFDGKTLIHPSQIDAANAAFAPDAAAVARAEAIIAAFTLPENAARGAIRVDGAMVERLHLAEAERLVALARAVTAGRPATSG